MRQLFSFLCLGAAALSATGCDRPAASSEPTHRSGEFRVLLPGRPSSLNPDTDVDEPAYVVGRSLFNHLVTLNEIGRVLPELAASWTTSPDGRTYTFALRRNVRWHDGTPFSSADVRWTLAAVAANGFARDALAPVERIDTPDLASLVITLKHPWAPFLPDLAQAGLAILPRHLYEGTDWRTNPANERPVGTGPFKFARWEMPDTLVLTANTDYFRSGPFVERLVFSVVPVDSIGDRLLSGEADYSLIRPPTFDYHRPPPAPLRYQALPSSARSYLAVNLRRAPFGDLRVRRAIASAIDRDELVRTALSGLGAPAVGWYTPDVEWAYNATVRVPDYDVQTAQQLLDAAGLRNPRAEQRFRATLVMPDMPPMAQMARVIQSQLARVGIGVEISGLPFSMWAKRVLTAHDYDLAIVAGNQGPDPDALRQRFLIDSPLGAYIGYDSARFREAVERGARTVDVSARAAAYHRAQEILADDVPFIPLTETVKVVLHNARVSGLPQLEARGLVGSFDFSLVKVGARRSESSR